MRAPVFIDCEPATWNMDPALLAEELDAAARRGRLPRAVVVVHLYGQSADLDPIVAACERYGVPARRGRRRGARRHATGDGAPARAGRFGVFSFNGNKIITTSGGGHAGLRRTASTIERARFLATQARDPAPHYQHSTVGLQLPDEQRAGRDRARAAPRARRAGRARAARNFASTRRRSGPCRASRSCPRPPYGRSIALAHAWSRSTRRSSAPTAEDVRLHLERGNIESRPVWKPMHLQPVFAGARRVGGAVAEHLFERGLCLPSGSALTDAERARVVETLLATPRTRVRRGRVAAPVSVDRPRDPASVPARAATGRDG